MAISKCDYCYYKYCWLKNDSGKCPKDKS